MQAYISAFLHPIVYFTDRFPGHVAFFSFISELKSPETYPKALFLLQGADISMYLIVAIVTYRYAGTEVASPALGSTSPLLRKIAYGVAIPTIIVAGVINGHVAAKYIYVRMFRGTDRMSKRSWSSFGLWAAIVLVLWIVAWIIAEAIPVFNDLLSLISSLFASWFTYGLSGVFWLFINRGRYRESPRKMFLTALNFATFCLGATIVSFFCCPILCFHIEHPGKADRPISVALGSMLLGRPSIRMPKPVEGLFHAVIIQ